MLEFLLNKLHIILKFLKKMACLRCAKQLGSEIALCVCGCCNECHQSYTCPVRNPQTNVWMQGGHLFEPKHYDSQNGQFGESAVQPIRSDWAPGQYRRDGQPEPLQVVNGVLVIIKIINNQIVFLY